MILRIQHRELTIDLDMRERIILHLAQDLQTRGRGSYSYVYVLTPEGQLLAEAIRRRAA